MISLGVLDQCKRRGSASVREALQHTLVLAELADRLGYRRYWLAEHHTADAAQSSPEVIVPLIAARTRRIRVGTGGILLRYYSPVKVAEVSLALEALFPGRIDLGVCRGPGVTSPAMAEALAGRSVEELTDESFCNKIRALSRYHVEAARGFGTDRAEPAAHPIGLTPPALWVLGSGGNSMRTAASIGAAYVLTCALGVTDVRGPPLLQEYRRLFSASHPTLRPRCCILVSVICLKSGDAARELDARFVQAGAHPGTIVGDPAFCARRLHELAALYQTDEVLITTSMGGLAMRAGLLQDIAQHCGLSAAA